MRKSKPSYTKNENKKLEGQAYVCYNCRQIGGTLIKINDDPPVYRHDRPCVRRHW